MKKNVGSMDKVIRLGISAILVYLYFSDTISGALGIVALVVAGVFTLTSIVGTCPIYSGLGLSTCKVPRK